MMLTVPSYIFFFSNWAHEKPPLIKIRPVSRKRETPTIMANKKPTVKPKLQLPVRPPGQKKKKTALHRRPGIGFKCGRAPGVALRRLTFPASESIGSRLPRGRARPSPPGDEYPGRSRKAKVFPFRAFFPLPEKIRPPPFIKSAPRGIGPICPFAVRPNPACSAPGLARRATPPPPGRPSSPPDGFT